MTRGKRIYALDTNVLMHDPTALFRFEEHDVFLPMTVLEELDAAKKGTSETARNARQVSRFINELIENGNGRHIEDGVELRHPQGLQLEGRARAGRLYFQTLALNATPVKGAKRPLPDNQILASILALREAAQGADRAGVEGHQPAHQGDDLRHRRRGLRERPRARRFQPAVHRPRRAAGRFLGSPRRDALVVRARPHVLRGQAPQGRGLASEPEPVPARATTTSSCACCKLEGRKATLQIVDDYRSGSHTVWGISARNREQNFALNALMDPDIDFVTLLGTAGTGKTLLALAAGLAQVMDQQRYREIIMTRATVSVGEDIGFLPGTEEEKMTPWMGALTDNLEVLTNPQEGGAWGRAATNDLLASRIKIRSLNFMRGRTFLSRYVIIDEAQNLTPKQMKTLITRAGPGSKMICLGNVEQIDTPYLTETTSGLTYAVDRFKDWEHSAHITLRRGERSRLADYASEVL